MNIQILLVLALAAGALSSKGVCRLPCVAIPGRKLCGFSKSLNSRKTFDTFCDYQVAVCMKNLDYKVINGGPCLEDSSSQKKN
ncbi:hypothetical protein J6590_030381 [Homalodisca vitripennis]|nr:hypothetical protein J6590_030381 [Homalodisca vitripennis]